MGGILRDNLGEGNCKSTLPQDRGESVFAARLGISTGWYRIQKPLSVCVLFFSGPNPEWSGALRKGPPFHGSRSSREIKIQNASCQMGGREVTR